MPPWAGLPAEQYALGTGSVRPGEARSVVAALQWPAAGRFGESAGRLPHPGHSTGGLTLAPSGGEAPGLGRPLAGPVNQTADTAALQMLIRQMQQQQEQQQQQKRQQQEQQMQQQDIMIIMLQNLGLQSQPTAAPPPHPPPLQPQNGRLEAGFCPQCERQEPHVCALSEEGGSVASCSRGAEVVVSPPGRRAPPDAPH